MWLNIQSVPWETSAGCEDGPEEMLVLRATPGPPRPGFCAKVSTSTKHTCSVGEPAEGSLPNRSTRWRALGPPPGAANPLIPPRANALVRTPARAAPSSATHQYRVAVPDAYAGGGLNPPPHAPGVQMTWENPSKNHNHNQFFQRNPACARQGCCFVTVIKLLAMDILAIATMKNAAKCDT